MNWRDLGLVVGFRKMGDRGAVAQIFTANYGKYDGWTKSKLLMGDFVNCVYKEKNENEMGLWTTENCLTILGNLSVHKFGNLILASICEFLNFNLPPRAPHPQLFFATWEVLYQLTEKEPEAIIESYLNWEKLFIQEMGFSVEEDYFQTKMLPGPGEIEENTPFAAEFFFLKKLLQENLRSTFFAREILYDIWKEHVESC